MHITEKRFYYVSQRFSLPQLQEKITLSCVFPTIIFSSKLANEMHHPKSRSQGGQKSTPWWSSINLNLALSHLSTAQREGLLGMGAGGRGTTLGLNIKKS